MFYPHIYLFLEEVIKSLHPHLTEQTEPLEREVYTEKGEEEEERERGREASKTPERGLT